MASFMDRLEAERARRDAALKRMKENVSSLTEDISEKVTETKAALAPRNIVENLKTEYSPDKMIKTYPWASIFAAMAAGFVIVPLFKRAAAAIPSQPAPPPQRVVIELKGAGPIAHTAVSNDRQPKSSIKEMIAEGAALVATVGNLMQHFNSSHTAHTNGNGSPSSESKRI